MPVPPPGPSRLSSPPPFFRLRLPGLVSAALAAVVVAACGQRATSATRAPADPPPPPSAAGAPLFVDVAADVGLDFVHFNGMSGLYHMAEVTGSGGALFDYDGDGDLDAYLVQGEMIAGKPLADATFPPRHPELGDRLYRNELVPEGRLRFTDVTAQSGTLGRGYGMGVAAGDYDNDGDVDLYVTQYGPNQLLRNRGDGTFEDVTAAAGVADRRWSVPAVFFDYDADGRLDLYVGNYIDADPESRRVCRDFVGTRDYCGPGAYPAEKHRLFRNRGDGTFEDVSKRSGVGEKPGPALGAVATDFDGDGRLDLYVANDSQPNFLWLQQADGTFREEAELAGCAVNAVGKGEASMGVDAADVDRDGDFELFMTHLTGESNTFYQNLGNGIFEDATARTGLGPPSIPYTSFGTGFFDYDNDGLLDVFVASGAVKKIEALMRAKDPFPFHLTNQLYRGTGGLRFVESTAEAGPALRLSEVSRGVAFGDVDEDGDVDLLISNNSGPVRLLRNEVGAAKPWLGLRLVTGTPPRDAFGARVAVDRTGAATLWGRIGTDRSFASANDPRAFFGLGDGEAVSGVRVYWGDGSAERFSPGCTRCYRVLRRGEGTPLVGTGP